MNIQPPASHTRAHLAYTPRGKPLRVCEFFRANPDEFLLSPDVVEKFGIAQPATELWKAVQAGLVTTEKAPRGSGNKAIYRAGPKL